LNKWHINLTLGCIATTYSSVVFARWRQCVLPSNTCFLRPSSNADTWKYCGFDETSMEFRPHVDSASVVIFRYRAISDSTCDKTIFKTVAIDYLKFFDVVG